MGYFFLYFLCAYFLGALIWNVASYHRLRHSATSLSTQWYHYDHAELTTNEHIYPELLKQIHAADIIWVSMFMWPYYADDSNKSSTLEPCDLKLAQYLHEKNITGNIFVDSINSGYKIIPEKLNSNAVINATGASIKWRINWQPNALPNNLMMWLIHTPWLQNIICKSRLTSLQKIYSLLKVSSNHQKVVITNQGETASVGSRNFDRTSWNNADMMVTYRGDFAKAIYQTAARTIAYLNPAIAEQVNDGVNAASTLTTSTIYFEQATQTNAARILTVAEIKSSILFLIKNSTQIEAEISVFTDSDIINAFNEFISRGGKLRLILDPNNYTFSFKLPNMPNVIPIKKLLPAAQVGVYDTQFQLHTKSALFYLSNGNTVVLSGTANWTDGALQRLAYNDIACLILNDAAINQSFMDMMDQAWMRSTPREKLNIKHMTAKIWLSKIMLFIGLNPW